MHDFKAAVDLLSGVHISGSNIFGDKAYGLKTIIKSIAWERPIARVGY